jgi:hypothetical protein
MGASVGSLVILNQSPRQIIHLRRHEMDPAPIIGAIARGNSVTHTRYQHYACDVSAQRCNLSTATSSQSSWLARKKVIAPTTIVTGASRGIGCAIAKRRASAGFGWSSTMQTIWPGQRVQVALSSK